MAADAPDIARLALEVQAVHVEAHPELFKPGGAERADAIAARMNDALQLYWIATLDGRAVGYAHARVVDEPESVWRFAARTIVLDQMGVSAPHRSRGIGSALWYAVRDTAMAERAERVILNVWAFNRAARRFYERIGFLPHHERLVFELERRGEPRRERATRAAMVVFLELAQFASESRRVGDGATADLLDAYYACAASEVKRAGGRVVKFIGDAVLAVFSDDRVDDAATVLLELASAVDRLMTERGWVCRLTTRAHVGSVVAGDFGAGGDMRFDIVGQTVQEAARLAGAPGAITFSPELLERLSPPVRARFVTPD
jgi:class 3 adenylate cyclase